MHKHRERIYLTILVAVLAAALLAVAFMPARRVEATGGGDPGTGTAIGWRTVTFADGSAAINATKYYSPSGYTTLGYLTQGWYKFDVFVTADVSGTNTLTVTPQVSVDGSNWVDSQYESEGWVLPLDYTATLTNTSGVTNTTTSTSTYTFAAATGTRVSEWVTYQVVLSADGSDYTIVPVHGNYLRFKAELASTGAGTAITPTITIVLRNDAGR